MCFDEFFITVSWVKFHINPILYERRHWKKKWATLQDYPLYKYLVWKNLKMYFYRIKFLVILFANFFKSLQGRQNKRNWKRTLQVNMLIIWDIFYNDHFLYLFCIDCTNMHTFTSLHTPKFSKSYGIFTQLLNIIQQSKIQTCQQHRWNYNDYILNWHTRRFSQFNFYLKLIIAKHLHIWISWVGITFLFSVTSAFNDNYKDLWWPWKHLEL